jgi:signal transduction histidine kinase
MLIKLNIINSKTVKSMFDNSNHLIDSLKENEWAKSACSGDEFWGNLKEWLTGDLLPEFINQVVANINSVIDIDPELSELGILETVAMFMTKHLDATYASVRLYDPDMDQMLSFGSYPKDEETRQIHISLENSIAGEVLKSGREYLVPNIMNEEKYRDKTVIQRKGVNSLFAIPFEIPRFFEHERTTFGVIQIYYPQADRIFSPLEVQMARLMSNRLGFVIARKKINSMHKMNEKKDKIVKLIFQKLGSWQGVKMKDIFNRLIPELADIINLQSCALFSVSSDREQVVLEAGYPDSPTYHGIGKSFPVKSETAFEVVLGLRPYDNESPYDLVTQSYALIIDPRKSTIISDNIRQLAANRNINSILYVPLDVGGEITHFMTFDALEQRKGYSQEEIEIFLFLGRELMKAQRLERLDDILHDFKNPAIAIAGFARRVNQMIENEYGLPADSKLKRYLNVLIEETSRLQEMTLSIAHIGKEQKINLTDVVKRRYEINREAIKEQLKENVVVEEGTYTDPLWINCYPLHVERIIDNILNNATNAIPLEGGSLFVKTYQEGDWACVDVRNTGVILDEDRRRVIEGDVQGRGLYITRRIVRLLNGNFTIKAGKKTTTVSLRLPVYKEE